MEEAQEIDRRGELKFDYFTSYVRIRIDFCHNFVHRLHSICYAITVHSIAFVTYRLCCMNPHKVIRNGWMVVH